ncbi:IF-2-associated domain-containing protein, partial [Xanthomonas translucens]
MSQQTTIRKLAELVNTPVDKLLVQLAEAGMKFSGPDQVVTSTEKMKLLGFLRRTHGKTDKPVEEEAQAAPKKITLNRRKLQEVTVSAGRSKTTVNVEVRQKRTYVKTAEDLAAERAGMASGGRVDDERAEILRKLEASKQRNLAEQQKLAEQDRARAEEIQRKRQAEQDARDRVEAERKAALEAESAPPA